LFEFDKKIIAEHQTHLGEYYEKHKAIVSVWLTKKEIVD